ASTGKGTGLLPPLGATGGLSSKLPDRSCAAKRASSADRSFGCPAHAASRKAARSDSGLAKASRNNDSSVMVAPTASKPLVYYFMRRLCVVGIIVRPNCSMQYAGIFRRNRAKRDSDSIADKAFRGQRWEIPHEKVGTMWSCGNDGMLPCIQRDR